MTTDKEIILNGVGKEKTKPWAKNTIQVYYNERTYLNLDKGIYPIVVLLNRHPKIHTHSSCEGHPNLFRKMIKHSLKVNSTWRQWFFSVQREVHCFVDEDFVLEFEKICDKITEEFNKNNVNGNGYSCNLTISKKLNGTNFYPVYNFSLYTSAMNLNKIKSAKLVDKQLDECSHILCKMLSESFGVLYEKHLQNYYE